MRSFKITILLFLVCFYCHAQPNINWILGTGFNVPASYNHKIDFTSGSPISSSLGTYNRLLTTLTCISDSASNLLFYSNGINVYNVLGDTMANGTGLSPSSWSSNYQSSGLNIIQAVVTIPIPGSSSKYFIVHESIDSSITSPSFPYFHFYCTKLYYSVIDMSLNGGLGEVIQKNENILPEFDTIAYGGLTCCRHSNGRDWWLISHGYQNDFYYTWLITPSGIGGPYKQSIGMIIPYGLGQCKFSSDGKKYASVIDGSNNFSFSIWLFNFDRCTGVLDSAIELNIIDSLWLVSGCEFSRNGRFLYSCTGRYFFQWDLSSNNIPQSVQLIDSAMIFYDSLLNNTTIRNYSLMQIGLDDKIYLTSPSSSSYLHIVNYPDSLGLNCSFMQHQIPIYCSHAQAIPNQVNFNLGGEIGSVCDSLGLAINELSQNDFQINPNPSNGVLYIHYQLAQNKNIWFEIYDVNGKVVFKYPLTPNSNEQQIKLSQPADGIYYCVITSENIRLCKTIAIIKN